MPTWYSSAVDALVHWAPFFVQVAVLSYVMWVLRNNYFTHEKALRDKLTWQIRRSLPLWPLIAGAIWGAIPWTPRLWFVESYFGGIQQGVCSGVASVFLPWIIEMIAAKRGIKLTPPDLPGDSEPPPT